MNEKIIKNCKHSSVLIQVGYWDSTDKRTGEPIGGPIVECKMCGTELKLPWEEWRELKKTHLIEQKLIVLK